MVVPGEGRAHIATPPSGKAGATCQPDAGVCGCVGVNRRRDYRKAAPVKVCSLFCILLLTNVLRYAIFISIIGMALYALSIGSLHTYCAALRAKSYKKAAHSAAFLLDFCAG